MKLKHSLQLFDCENEYFNNLCLQDKLNFLKNKYRSLILVYHPDKNIQKENENYNNYFKIIKESYDILTEHYKQQHQQFDLSVQQRIINMLKTFIKTGNDQIDDEILRIGKKIQKIFD